MKLFKSKEELRKMTHIECANYYMKITMIILLIGIAINCGVCVIKALKLLLYLHSQLKY